VTIVAFEADRTTVTVNVPLPAPVLAWSEAIVKRGTTRLVASTLIVAPRTVIVTIPSASMTAGLWKVQVRAGATEAGAQTVYDGNISVRDSI
jgi:hypothetical protein